jgi:Tol biopolymer transport system component
MQMSSQHGSPRLRFHLSPRFGASMLLLILAACTAAKDRTDDADASAPSDEERDASVVATDAQEARSPSPSHGEEARPSFTDARVIMWQTGVKNAYPRWSRDAKSILFQSNRSGKWQIYVMDAAGENVRQLTSDGSNSDFPDWSPDNRSIAFVSDRNGNEDVYVMQMDGSGLRDLSNDPARDIHPYWEPDGKKLLFNSTRDGDKLQIYEVDLDGKNLHRLVASQDDDTCARIRPEGDSFVYLSNLSVGQDDVLLRRRDGSQPINLTHDSAPDGWPTWMPDGRSIVYSSAKSGTFCLYVMGSDGSDPRQLTFATRPYGDARACVSADGRRIVFNRDKGETIGICVLELPSSTAARS